MVISSLTRGDRVCICSSRQGFSSMSCEGLLFAGKRLLFVNDRAQGQSLGSLVCANGRQSKCVASSLLTLADSFNLS